MLHCIGNAFSSQVSTLVRKTYELTLEDFRQSRQCPNASNCTPGSIPKTRERKICFGMHAQTSVRVGWPKPTVGPPTERK